MKYKGYFAEMHISEEDNLLYGIIRGINDVISFQAETVQELKKAFEDAVDDYLDLCERLGKQPEKEYKGSFNVRISPRLHKKAAYIAMKEGITLNQYVEKSIFNEVNKIDREKITKTLAQFQLASENYNHKVWENVNLTSIKKNEIRTRRYN